MLDTAAARIQMRRAGACELEHYPIAVGYLTERFCPIEPSYFEPGGLTDISAVWQAQEPGEEQVLRGRMHRVDRAWLYTLHGSGLDFDCR
jgi:hypothetical protein